MKKLVFDLQIPHHTLEITGKITLLPTFCLSPPFFQVLNSRIEKFKEVFECLWHENLNIDLELL
jgi:hypothetical protein